MWRGINAVSDSQSLHEEDKVCKSGDEALRLDLKDRHWYRGGRVSTAVFAVALYSRDGTSLRLVSVPPKPLLMAGRARL